MMEVYEGVLRNSLLLCVECGYGKEKRKLIHRELRMFQREFARLARIEIPI